ncbi:MAG TPA: hypothetical protein VFU47_08260 [Armatimonadota bacterium]|nr:hypothetical protein [Armatimonadota bacterium]
MGDRTAARKAIAVFFWLVGVLVLLSGALFVWILRDGLGPDARDSHGLAALLRFGAGMAQLGGFYLVPLVLGAVIYPWGASTGRGEDGG